MPRAKYKVNAADYTHACFYLGDKLRNQDFEFSHEASATDARSDYFEIVHAGQRKGRAERLNTWCEKYLIGSEWLKLKTAIRKRRERWERHDQIKTISISAKAHKLLAKIAERDDVTFSEILEHVLLKTAKSAARVPLKQSKSRFG